VWDFFRFLIIWISDNLSIPFWSVGHIHLSISDYQISTKILASLIMHIIVGFGFFLSYKDHLNEKKASQKRNYETLKFYIDTNEKD